MAEKKVTRADRVRAMTDEKLAGKFAQIMLDTERLIAQRKYPSATRDLKERFLEVLQEPAEEEPAEDHEAIDKVPLEQVLDDMYDPYSAVSGAARDYYYSEYATEEERKAMDREDRINTIISACLLGFVVVCAVVGLFF